MTLPPTSNCSFVLYTVVSSPQHFSLPPEGLDRDCALLLAYGNVASNLTSWRRLQAEMFTPKEERNLSGRVQSRVLKLKSYLLGVDKPLVYVDIKRRTGIHNIAAMLDILRRMAHCNASIFTYIHPERPHDILGEFRAIRRFRRTSNFSRLKKQENAVRGDVNLYADDRAKRTFVNDGSLIIRQGDKSFPIGHSSFL